jgi:hypothetical protein
MGTTRTEYLYDAAGRVVLERSRSRNPEFTREFRTEYAGDIVTTHPPLGAPTSTRITRDDEGRVSRETRWDARDRTVLSDVVYRYALDTVETTGSENGITWRHTKKQDQMGNVVESTSDMAGGLMSRTTALYEYDGQGNWIRSVSTMSSSVTPASRNANLELREIGYYLEQ